MMMYKIMSNMVRIDQMALQKGFHNENHLPAEAPSLNIFNNRLDEYSKGIWYSIEVD